MLDTRWKKLASDLWIERNRVTLMIASVAISLIAVGAVVGAYAILTREIERSYLGTHPAAATLELETPIDAALLVEARKNAELAEVDARETILARAKVGDDWLPLLVFVVDDFEKLRLNTFTTESGAWPPPEGTMLLERSALPVLETKLGASLMLKTPHGSKREVMISGIVHDPGLAPAWQEREGYAYVTRATIAALGEAPELHELLVTFKDPHGIERQAAELARALDRPVHQIRVPPFRQHPHQRQMTTILVLLLAFSGMAALLSAILVATSLAAMLARQVREIGVMKAIGARADQIAIMYVVWIAALGVASFALAWLPGEFAVRTFAGEVSKMLNFELASTALPPWVVLARAATAIGVALIVAAIPIARASRISVREAIDQHGLGGNQTRVRFSSLPYAVRNAFRRPARLALTLALLAAGGAMFMTALNVKRSWEKNLEKIPETHHYDVEVRFHREESIAIAAALARIPGVVAVEPWGYSEAAFAKRSEIDLVRTYPDRSHGSLVMLAPPADTHLISLPVKAGRWLEAGDSDAVVLNHIAFALAGRPALGSRVLISLDGRPVEKRVVGVVEEIGAAGVAYFARSEGEGAGTARMLRIVTNSESGAARTELMRAIDRALVDRGLGVETVIPLAELRTAMGEHIGILIRALFAMAAIMALVGMLGLGSSMGINVLERVREIGVMKALGATPARVARTIVAEALFTGASSWVIAFLLSLALTWLVDALVGSVGFVAPLPFAIELDGLIFWAGLVAPVSVLATALPARRAARLSVREAIAHT